MEYEPKFHFDVNPYSCGHQNGDCGRKKNMPGLITQLACMVVCRWAGLNAHVCAKQNSYAITADFVYSIMTGRPGFHQKWLSLPSSGPRTEGSCVHRKGISFLKLNDAHTGLSGRQVGHTVKVSLRSLRPPLELSH